MLFQEVRFKESFGPQIWEKDEESKELNSKSRALQNGDDGYKVINIYNDNARHIYL